MVAKLKTMARLDASTYLVYKIERVIVCILCALVVVGGASARYRAEAPEEDYLYYDSVFLVMIVFFFFAFLLATYFGAKTCIVFYEAWQATSIELREGGAEDTGDLARTDRAVKIQFLTALGGMVTSMLFFLANGMEQARSLRERMFDVNPNIPLAQLSNGFLYVTVFVDSICNDLCAHWMMLTVSARSLRNAQSVMEERAERAAQELRQHDVAMQAMQAGPTSLERTLELMQRERHVRAEVLRDASSDTLNIFWAALRSLATAEAKRINQLLYCVRLRAMIMPLRFQVLHDLQSLKANPRQPVPQEFLGGTPEQANAFFDGLVQDAHLHHKNFVAMLEQAVEVFNRASSPGELGLDKEKFPFKIWRDHSHSTAGDAKGIKEAEQSGGTSRRKSKHLYYKPSIGEIVRMTDDGAEARKGRKIQVPASSRRPPPTPHHRVIATSCSSSESPHSRPTWFETASHAYAYSPREGRHRL
jgi:hypothetical protein